jgi:hypothetical protein
MRCLRCNYRLSHLESNACPECGRAYDPDDSRTYRRADEPTWWLKQLRSGKAAIVAVMLLVLYWQWLDRAWSGLVWTLTGPRRTSAFSHVAYSPAAPRFRDGTTIRPHQVVYDTQTLLLAAPLLVLMGWMIVKQWRQPDSTIGRGLTAAIGLAVLVYPPTWRVGFKLVECTLNGYVLLIRLM